MQKVKILIINMSGMSLQRSSLKLKTPDLKNALFAKAITLVTYYYCLSQKWYSDFIKRPKKTPR